MSCHPQQRTLFIGDIARHVNKTMLEAAFIEYGEIEMIDIKQDKYSGFNLGYAFIRYATRAQADIARNAMNYKDIGGKPIRVGWAQKNSTIFVARIPSGVTNDEFRDFMRKYGEIIDEESFISRNRFGFVKYVRRKHAEKAKEQLDGIILKFPSLQKLNENESKISRVAWGDALTQRHCVHVQFDSFQGSNMKFCENDFLTIFKKFGKIERISLAHYADMRLKGYGFICYEESDDGETSAAEAIIALNNTYIQKSTETETETENENGKNKFNHDENNSENININININVDVNNQDNLDYNKDETSSTSSLLITCNFGKRQTNHSKTSPINSNNKDNNNINDDDNSTNYETPVKHQHNSTIKSINTDKTNSSRSRMIENIEINVASSTPYIYGNNNTNRNSLSNSPITPLSHSIGHSNNVTPEASMINFCNVINYSNNSNNTNNYHYNNNNNGKYNQIQSQYLPYLTQEITPTKHRNYNQYMNLSNNNNNDNNNYYDNLPKQNQVPTLLKSKSPLQIITKQNNPNHIIINNNYNYNHNHVHNHNNNNRNNNIIINNHFHHHQHQYQSQIQPQIQPQYHEQSSLNSLSPIISSTSMPKLLFTNKNMNMNNNYSHNINNANDSNNEEYLPFTLPFVPLPPTPSPPPFMQTIN